jgi:RimJ/RimL family protein N-acetyltransferase
MDQIAVVGCPGPEPTMRLLWAPMSLDPPSADLHLGGVGLRAVTEADLDWLVAMSVDREAVGPHNWVDGRDPIETRAELASRLDQDGCLGERDGRLVIELNREQPIGEVSWRSEHWGPSPRSRCPAIGIALLPEHRGRGFGTLAQQLVVRYLFESTDAQRVQSDTAVDNPAEQRALEKAGFVREGVVRQAEWRDGRYHDHILYSVLRSEWTRPT